MIHRIYELRSNLFLKGYHDGIRGIEPNSNDEGYIEGWNKGKEESNKMTTNLRGGIDDIGLIYAERKKKK